MSGQGGRVVEASSGPDRVEIQLGDAAVPVDLVPPDFVVAWCRSHQQRTWDIVVTPNLHHLRVVRDEAANADKYSAATLSLADGWPVAWLASRVAGRPVERVVGADLFESLIESHGDDSPLVLIGGSPGPELASLFERCRRLSWAISGEPAPRAELVDPKSRAALVKRVADAGTGGIIVIGLGAPIQEELAYEIATQSGSGAILCLGNSINFSSGLARRAPKWIQALHMEWAYRALSEPRRLLGRYLQDLLVLPILALKNPRR